MAATRGTTLHNVVDHRLSPKDALDLVASPLNRHKIGDQIKPVSSSDHTTHSQQFQKDGTSLDLIIERPLKAKIKQQYKQILAHCEFNESSNEHNNIQAQTTSNRIPPRQKKDVASVASTAALRRNFILWLGVNSYLDTASKHELQALGKLLTQIDVRKTLPDLTSKKHRDVLTRFSSQGNRTRKANLKSLTRRVKLSKQLDKMVSNLATLRTVSQIVNAKLDKTSLQPQLNDRPELRITRHGITIVCGKRQRETAKSAKKLRGLKRNGKAIQQTVSVRSNNANEHLKDVAHDKPRIQDTETTTSVIASQPATKDKIEKTSAVNATRVQHVGFSTILNTANTATSSLLSAPIVLTVLSHVIIRLE